MVIYRGKSVKHHLKRTQVQLISRCLTRHDHVVKWGPYKWPEIHVFPWGEKTLLIGD